MIGCVTPIIALLQIGTGEIKPLWKGDHDQAHYYSSMLYYFSK